MTAPARRSAAEWDVPLALVAADAAPDRQAFLTAAAAALAEHRMDLPFGAVPDPHDFDPADTAFAALPAEHPERIETTDWTPEGGAS